MSRELSHYVWSCMAHTDSINAEMLLVIRFYVEKWKKGMICGPDEELTALLEKEEYDDESMEELRQSLVRIASSTTSDTVFQQVVGILQVYGDERHVPLFQAWLLREVQGLVRHNSGMWAILLALQECGERPMDRPTLSLTDVENNLGDARRYLREKLGVNVPG